MSAFQNSFFKFPNNILPQMNADDFCKHFYACTLFVSAFICGDFN